MEKLELIKTQEVLGRCFKVYGTVENPLFLAKDVAEWIDYSVLNTSKMLASVDEDEKTTRTIITSGNYQTEAWFLTENGLYEVLMQSRKPIAKEFKREVKKILHEIRMTGGYTVPQTYSEALQLAADQQKRIEEQRRLIEKQDTQIAEQRKTISEQAPKADAYDDYVDMGEFCNFRDAANYLRVTQTELMDLLRTKYIYKNEAGEYRCYAEHAECFMLRPYKKSVRATDKDTGRTYTAERTGSQLMMTIAGLTKFGRILSEMHEERQKEIFDSAMSAARSLLQGMKPCFPMCKAG